MDEAFWKNKKVLITGHTGFKGSWLTLWMQMMGARVIGYSLDPPSNPNLYSLAKVGEHIYDDIHGDIRDEEYLNSVIQKHKPEIVLHLAAQSLVRTSYKDPLETYSTNVMGTANLLDSVRRNSNSVRVVICVTSDKCYENKNWVWGYRENDRLGGYDPYSSSKGCCELVAASFRNSYFHPDEFEKHKVAVATVRAGNVIGGGDWSDDRLISDIMKAFLKNEQVVIRNPNAIRPWQHVLEGLRGYITLAEKMWEDGSAYSEAWNFGPDMSDSKPVGEIVQRMSKLWGEGASWTKDGKDHPHEAEYLKVDSSKAKSKLGWSPILDLERSLDWIIEWYMNYNKGENMRSTTESQIRNYSKLYSEK